MGDVYVHGYTVRESQRLQDQAFLLGTLTPAAFGEAMNKTTAEMRLK